jgi:hypothetical protein
MRIPTLATKIIFNFMKASLISVFSVFTMNVFPSKSDPIMLLDESSRLEETTSLHAADALIFQNQEVFNPRFLSLTTAATETTSDTLNSTMSFIPVEFYLFSFNLSSRD